MISTLVKGSKRPQQTNFWLKTEMSQFKAGATPKINRDRVTRLFSTFIGIAPPVPQAIPKAFDQTACVVMGWMTPGGCTTSCHWSGGNLRTSKSLEDKLLREKS